PGRHALGQSQRIGQRFGRGLVFAAFQPQAGKVQQHRHGGLEVSYLPEGSQRLLKASYGILEPAAQPVRDSQSTDHQGQAYLVADVPEQPSGRLEVLATLARPVLFEMQQPPWSTTSSPGRARAA